MVLGTVSPGSVAAGEQRGEVTINGTVTGIDGEPGGDAVVLIAEDSTLTKFSPAELRALATDLLQNQTVVNITADGHFETILDP